MKLSQVQLGTRAERPVEFSYRGTTVKLAIRPLVGTEEGLALERTTAYATEKKAAKVEPGNSLFDLGLMAHTLVLACVDIDSPVDAREPFFDGGIAQVFDLLDTEQIVYLAAQFELWRDECSPSQKRMSADQLIATLYTVAASGSDLPLRSMAPALLVSCLATTASLLFASHEPKSPPTPPSVATG